MTCDIRRDALDSGPAGISYPLLQPNTADPGYGPGVYLEGFFAPTGQPGLEADNAEGFVAPIAEDYVPTIGDDSVRLHIGSDPHSMILMELDASGVPREIYHNRVPTVTSGCPFCGSHNWKG